MTKLDSLYLEHGQSPWIDNIRRDWLEDGTLAALVDRGVRGVTSNPAIFAKALATSSAYDTAIASSSASLPEELFEELAIADVQSACDVLANVHAASVREFASGARRYTDGYVSLEVSPRLAYDTTATVAAATRLAQRVERDNLMIKIPATVAGLGAIRETLARGISVNVTLIFSLERYAQVMDEFVLGVREAIVRGHDPRRIASVASFFVSRVDSAADPLLDAHPALKGHGANAQVASAYQLYLDRFERTDAAEILSSGGQVQRPLWASTSTKNPDYDPLLYVVPLIANETVNTMPEATFEMFSSAGTFDPAAISDDATRQSMLAQFDQLSSLIDVHALTAQLEHDGVKAFEDSYRDLLDTVGAKLHRS